MLSLVILTAAKAKDQRKLVPDGPQTAQPANLINIGMFFAWGQAKKGVRGSRASVKNFKFKVAEPRMDPLNSYVEFRTKLKEL